MGDGLALHGLSALLVLARVVPLGLALASFSDGWVPLALGLSLSLALTAAVLPLAGEAPRWAGLGALAPWLLRELCIGATFAVALSLALIACGWTVRMTQARDTRAPVDALGRAYVLCACWLVLSLGGLRAVVIALVESFRDAPLSARSLSASSFALGSAQLLVDAFALAVGFGLPLLLGVWLLELTSGLLARVLLPSAHGTTPLLRPLLALLAYALLLVPIASRGPEAARLAIATARVLTRALVR